METASLVTLRDPVDGDVIAPGDADYSEAREIWNAMIDREPAAIVRPRNADDVAEAIAFARAHDLPLAVRGGGHNVAGNATVDDGLVIDFCDMRAVEVDAAGRTARGRGRSAALGPRRGNGRAWACGPRRHHLNDWRCRFDPRGWFRLAFTEARPHDRQPPLGRSGDGGR
jgi:FAD binding domain